MTRSNLTASHDQLRRYPPGVSNPPQHYRPCFSRADPTNRPSGIIHLDRPAPVESLDNILHCPDIVHSDVLIIQDVRSTSSQSLPERCHHAHMAARYHHSPSPSDTACEAGMSHGQSRTQCRSDNLSLDMDPNQMSPDSADRPPRGRRRRTCGRQSGALCTRCIIKQPYALRLAGRGAT